MHVAGPGDLLKFLVAPKTHEDGSHLSKIGQL